MTPARAQALNVSLTTARLSLEPLTAAHADALFAPLQEEALYTWISLLPPPSVEKLRDRWTWLEGRLSPSGEEAWLNWIVRRVDDGACVGKLDASVDDAGVATNVGYLFFPAYWGQGLATEAVIAVAEHLERHGVTEQRATVTVGNGASGRVLEKAGFARTRILPENDVIRGVTHDDIEYVRRVTP
jgi:ribosomal-protein-alanine N-acetyltransferase